MFKKIVFTISFILISLYGIAQKNINNYKYIIVPKKFDFLNAEDQYQLNSLTKFLFNKHGYEAYFLGDDFPVDLKNERCLALTSEVSNEKGGMFKSKLEIILKDCFGDVVMTSDIGESRLKQYDRAYVEALRGAFETFQNLEYKYVPKEIETDNKEERIELKVIEEPKDNVDIIEAKEKEVGLVEVKKLDTKEVKVSSEKEYGNNLYYAQAISNGFQLVNSEPRIVMVLLTTACENVFMVKDKNAIVFEEDGFWYYSENNGKLSERESMNIKF